MRSPRTPVVIIGGPTGAGKTRIGLALARRCGGEIVSADSRQLFREISIGTDKTPPEMREDVVHHMLDFLSLADPFDVSRFAAEALRITEDILGRGRIPVIVGGSGLYLRVLTRGIFPMPDAARRRQDAVRRELEEEPTGRLFERLMAADPQAARRLHCNDRRRIRRALEVWLLTGKRMSEWHAGGEGRRLADLGRVVYVVLALPRAALWEAIDRRVDRMMDQGWLEEVRQLKGRGFDEALRRKAPIGYGELLDCLEGKRSLAETTALIKRRTHALARRQMTWFRREPAEWMDVSRSDDEVVEAILERVRETA